MVPLAEAEFHAARHVIGLRHGPDGLELGQDDRVAWKAMRRHLTGPEAVARLDALREHRAVFSRDLSITVPDPPPLMGWGAPPVNAFPAVPGLTLEPMHAGHLDEAAAIAIEAGLGPATCPPECGQCQPPEAHTWLRLAGRLDHPDQWQFALSFQGRPLQYEVIVFDPTRTVATFSITYHTSAGRERPSWFHHEVEQPVFAAMQQVGIRTVISRTRADRPDWIASLQARYGAVDTGPLSGGTIRRLEFPLDLSRFAGLPTRKQVGFDRTLGRVRVWEATAADLPALHQLIDSTIPPARKILAHRVAEEWWHLDRATLLLGSRDGVLRYARAIRPRRGAQGALTFLSGLFDEPELEGSAQLVLQWAKQAGYTTLTSFVQAGALTAGGVPMLRQARGMRIVKEHTRFREPFTEIEFDVP